jgi:uncharacterized hydrophobic protein (TIGR00271 family)
MARSQSPENVAEFGERMLADVRIDRGYLALLIGAALMASFGLEQNSAATIIGAMVIAPVMLPIRTLGYGLLRFDRTLIGRALLTLGVSIAIVVTIGAAVGWFSARPDFGSELLSRTDVTGLGLGVALTGGALAALSRSWKDSKITDSMIGVGISVALVPPLCTAGIALIYHAPADAAGAFMIFLTNLVGISLAGMIVFWLTGFAAREAWRAYSGLAIFVVLLIAIVPVIGATGYRAREESAIRSFVDSKAAAYLPDVLRVESSSVSWKTPPYGVVVTVQSRKTPDRAEVQALSDALAASQGTSYRLTVVQDPAVTVSP